MSEVDSAAVRAVIEVIRELRRLHENGLEAIAWTPILSDLADRLDSALSSSGLLGEKGEPR